MRFRLFVALLVLFCAATVSAQDTIPTAKFANPVKVKELLPLLAPNTEIRGLEQVPDDAVWSEDLPVDDRREAINTVAASAGFDVVDVKGGLELRPTNTRYSYPTPPPPPQAQPEDPMRDLAGVIGRTYPDPPKQTEGRVGGYAARRMAATRPVYVPAPPRTYSVSYEEPAVHPRGIVGVGSRHSYYPYLHERWFEWRRDFELRGSLGSLKTHGDTGGVSMYVNGCYVGPANKLDDRNKKAVIPAGIPVMVMAVDDESGMAFHRPMIFPTLAAGKAIESTGYVMFGIDDRDFESAHTYKFNRTLAEDACIASQRR